MFERFTDRARRVVVLSQEEARMLYHNYIGTEHVLLGLIREETGIAVRVLRALGVTLEDVRAQIEVIIGRGPTSPPGHIPFTPRAKKILEFSLREALQLGHNYIGTEHILLGLVRECLAGEREAVAAQILTHLGVDFNQIRTEVLELMRTEAEARRGTVPTTPPGTSQGSGQGRSLSRIEPIEDPPGASNQPVAGPSVLPRADVSAAPEPVRERLRLAVRLGSAASALVYFEHIHAAGRGSGAVFAREPQETSTAGAWWVSAELELDLARELTDTVAAELFTERDGRLVRTPGWGTPSDDAETVDPDLHPVTVRELIRIAGLSAAARPRLRDARIVAPGHRVARIVHRALDLGLTVRHRPIRLWPLFEAEDRRDAAGTMIEVSVSAAGESEISTAFLAAMARWPGVTVCRSTGEALLVQYDVAAPVADRTLAGLTGSETWILARAPFGCWVGEACGEYVDSTSLLRLADGYGLASTEPAENDVHIDPPGVRLASAPTPRESVDAILLDDSDIPNLALLLEGHPLAEIASLVKGDGKCLLIAPGGVLERLPMGELLYCLGPGPLFVPLGFRLRPTLPTAARRTLFGVGPGAGVVLLPDSGLVFDLSGRQPVWRQWIGQMPEVDRSLSPESIAELEDLEPAARRRPQEPHPASGERSSGLLQFVRRRRERLDPADAEPATWEEEALIRELAGDLLGAAELHERNGDLVRAGHLFERAGREAATP
ncbi:hypothetical protein J5X84_15535 [Streptosporangiaceae bacterium NEAU-GS5]|nr:hypothetical protein [Streptosporangiaceae bacterium NEAU-GS5]